MKRITLLLVPVFLILSACHERECVDLNKEKKEIELVLEKYVIANEEQKIELAEEIWADDGDIVAFGTSSDEKLVGWKEIKSTIQKQFDTFTNTYLSVENQKVNINKTGNTAWFSEIVSYNFIQDSIPVSYEGIRYTGVLEKRDGKWVIVQSHMSIPSSE
jgi:hypothetical protein